ncbi:hypothetical protein BUALT_Bualt05G0058400 [Buddleja alternifolia]|uniref:Transcription factor CBF/NF-Y/archaeal histone domain-containing protein n=1 Tax=Buddleja alternifolia TaxID=168488 RepID=A0AAV6XNY2_9LAMI|nr:hypothetical protein BUALT_Bualt05G0058400 [Buddleja alternifolia]
MRQPGAYSKLLSGGISSKTGPHSLPLARIKKIMKKSGDDVKMISGEAPIVFSKACELFIEELTKRAWVITVEGKRRTVHKEDVASAVITTDVFDFLVNLVSHDQNPTISLEKLNDILEWYYKTSLVHESILRACGLSAANVNPVNDIGMVTRKARMSRKLIDEQEAAKKAAAAAAAREQGGTTPSQPRRSSIQIIEPDDPQINQASALSPMMVVCAIVKKEGDHRLALAPYHQFILLPLLLPRKLLLLQSFHLELALCIHQLTLNSAHHKDNYSSSERELVDYNEQVTAKLKTIEEDRAKAGSLQSELNTICKSLDIEKAKTTKLHRCMANEIGVKEFISSPNFAAKLHDARLNGVKDFVRSTQFDDIIISRAIDDQRDGFYKAIDYLKQIGGFNVGVIPEEFERDYVNMDLLRPSLTPDDESEYTNFPEFNNIVRSLGFEPDEGRVSTSFQRELDATAGRLDEPQPDSRDR